MCRNWPETGTGKTSLLSGGKAEYMDFAAGRLVVLGLDYIGLLFVIASIFSVKQEAKPSAESEER